MDFHSDDGPVAEVSGDDPRPAGLEMTEVEAFGANPGGLRMILGVPPTRSTKRPLVVALHGCTQTATGFAAGSGWERLAARHDVLLLLPEQKSANNRQTCFSWFEPGDTRRGFGEVASIRAMIATTIDRYGADPSRVFVTGLSAGGAMAGAMLAAYPELFVAGAIVAGLPYGAASGTGEAFEAMMSGRTKDPRAWGDIVRAASDHHGRWPRVSVWHGMGDTVVKPINAGELVKQWTNVHGVGDQRPETGAMGPARSRVWRNASGEPVVTEVDVPGLGHGMPVADATPPGPFFLPAGLSASERICGEFGLIEAPRSRSLLARFGLGR